MSMGAADKQMDNSTKVRHLLFPGICLGVALVCLVLGLTGGLSSNALRYLMQIFLYITVGEAWNLISGYAGLNSLGQQLYIGLAGYAVAVTSTTYHLPLGVGMAAGAVICLIAALLSSLLLFRMNGMYFAIASWVIAEAVCLYFLSWSYVNQGGGMTITLSPYPKVREIYYLTLALCLAAVLLIYGLLRSKVGLAWLSIRDYPEAALVTGVNIRKYKLLAFVVSAVLFSLAGSLFFVNKGVIYPESGFHISWTISVVFIVIIGGSGTIAGPMVGAVLYVILHEQFAHYPGWSNILLGGITILVIMFLPEGIVGAIQKVFHIDSFETRRSPEPVSPQLTAVRSMLRRKK